MSQYQDLADRFRVPPGGGLKLAECDPAWTFQPKLPKSARRQLAERMLQDDVQSLARAQELLYADDSWSVLVIFQAMDAAGKDGTIKHVMSGVNPQGVQVYSFKHPSAEELDHNFLWRCMKVLPERGRIGIFNRSYYEEVLIVRVHPELVAAQRIPGVKAGKSLWKQRFEDINAFERHLARNGTAIVKFFLHVSKEEQKRRLLARMDDPGKQWKFNLADLGERAWWNDYMRAYEECLNATSTRWAPWYVIPADFKWVSRALVARILCETIESLALRFPQVSDHKRAQIEQARRQLMSE